MIFEVVIYFAQVLLGCVGPTHQEVQVEIVFAPEKLPHLERGLLCQMLNKCLQLLSSALMIFCGEFPMLSRSEGLLKACVSTGMRAKGLYFSMPGDGLL